MKIPKPIKKLITIGWIVGLSIVALAKVTPLGNWLQSLSAIAGITSTVYTLTDGDSTNFPLSGSEQIRAGLDAIQYLHIDGRYDSAWTLIEHWKGYVAEYGTRSLLTNELADLYYHSAWNIRNRILKRGNPDVAANLDSCLRVSPSHHEGLLLQSDLDREKKEDQVIETVSRIQTESKSWDTLPLWRLPSPESLDYRSQNDTPSTLSPMESFFEHASEPEVQAEKPKTPESNNSGASESEPDSTVLPVRLKEDSSERQDRAEQTVKLLPQVRPKLVLVHTSSRVSDESVFRMTTVDQVVTRDYFVLNRPVFRSTSLTTRIIRASTMLIQARVGLCDNYAALDSVEVLMPEIIAANGIHGVSEYLNGLYGFLVHLDSFAAIRSFDSVLTMEGCKAELRMHAAYLKCWVQLQMNQKPDIDQFKNVVAEQKPSELPSYASELLEWHEKTMPSDNQSPNLADNRNQPRQNSSRSANHRGISGNPATVSH